MSRVCAYGTDGKGLVADTKESLGTMRLKVCEETGSGEGQVLGPAEHTTCILGRGVPCCAWFAP